MKSDGAANATITALKAGKHPIAIMTLQKGQAPAFQK